MILAVSLSGCSYNVVAQTPTPEPTGTGVRPGIATQVPIEATPWPNGTVGADGLRIDPSLMSNIPSIVGGNPLQLSGEPGDRAAKTHAFAAELGELTGLPIHFWDERLTTREAHEILYKAGHARQKHRKVVDQVAATLILQSFLDEKTSS